MSIIKESITNALEGIVSDVKCCYDGPQCVHATLVADADGNVICSECFSPIHDATNSDKENEELKEEFLQYHEIKGNINERNKNNKEDDGDDKLDVLKHIRMPSPQQKGGSHRDKTKYDRKRDNKKEKFDELREVIRSCVFEAKEWIKDGFDVPIDCMNALTDSKNPLYGSFDEDEVNIAYLVKKNGRFRCSRCQLDSEDPRFMSIHRLGGLVKSINEVQDALLNREPVLMSCSYGDDIGAGEIVPLKLEEG